MNENNICLSNGKASLLFKHVNSTPELFARLAVTLRPHFIAASDGKPDLVVELGAFASAPPLHGEFSRLQIRSSSAAPFNLTVDVGISASGAFLARDESTAAAYLLKGEGQIAFFGAPSAFFHLLELVRYSALVVEQAKGSLVFHASAIATKDGATLIVGSKGAGKTTTLAHMLSHPGTALVSGDKVLVDQVDGQLRVRGWPDFPHIGLGTLRAVPSFARTCGLDLEDPALKGLADDAKILVEPGTLAASLDPPITTGPMRVARIVFPNVRATQRFCCLLAPQDHDLHLLQTHSEDPWSFGVVRWHSLIDHFSQGSVATRRAILADMRMLDWWRIDGLPDSAELAGVLATHVVAA